LASTPIFEMDEARHCKFGMDVNPSEYWPQQNGVIPKWACSGSHDTFKYSYISHNISETVAKEDMHNVTMEHLIIGSHI